MLPPPFADALILTGPTGSGKTGLALELAQELGAEIVSMDSMALYRHMDIGTAKPTMAQREQVPHHLIDVLEPWESASVAWWLERAAACCREISGRGKKILFVGGTPLYIKALMFGLFDGPPANEPVRRRLDEEVARLGAVALHEQLARSDPRTAARLHPNDTRRVIRALEVLELTGRPISTWQKEWRQSDHAGEPAPASGKSIPQVLWLDLPRSELYDRINLRVRGMFAAGWVEEVRALTRLEQDLGREASAALGYKEILAFLGGAHDLEETIARIQTRTRNFAKRQITWFRHLPGCQTACPQLTRTLWRPKMEK